MHKKYLAKKYVLSFYSSWQKIQVGKFWFKLGKNSCSNSKKYKIYKWFVKLEIYLFGNGIKSVRNIEPTYNNDENLMCDLFLSFNT